MNQDHILATELANHLTDQGIAFREAYGIVAGLVELALKDIQTLTQGIDQNFLNKLTFEATVEKRNFAGGTSLEQINKQIQLLM